MSSSFSRREFILASGATGLALLTRPLALGARPSPAGSASAGSSIAPFRIEGDALIVPAGSYPVGNRSVVVRSEARLAIAPANIVTLQQEPLKLSSQKPSGFFVGTRLQGPKTSSIGAMNSLIESSLALADGEGRPLTKGTDYLVSARFALLGIGEHSRVTPETTVFATYKYYRQRIDSVVVDATGTASVLSGSPALVSPMLPAAPAGSVAICNVYRPYGGSGLEEGHVFPIDQTPEQAVTYSTPGRLNRTIRKLRAGEPVTVVCWGDSITVGADVAPAQAWANRLPPMLQQRFPRSKINHLNHSIGGTKSAQWLHNGDFPGLPKQNPEVCRFENVLEEKPDVVVMEFLNDIVLEDQARQETYETISREFQTRGIEWVIVTPSHKMPENFDLSEMKRLAPRPIDLFLTKFADTHGHALADTSARWRHLSREGIPFFALFNNGYNHPNAFGHRLFVEEIMKCFPRDPVPVPSA